MGRHERIPVNWSQLLDNSEQFEKMDLSKIEVPAQFENSRLDFIETECSLE